MKMLRCCARSVLLFTLPLVTWTCGNGALAQTINSNVIPVVTIEATQPIATSPTNPGVFTVFRQGDTNETLNVYYLIEGTASNGVDYAMISQYVNIPAGAVSNNIIITPLDSPPTPAAKTIFLQLAPSPLLTPVNFEIGAPSNALVYINYPGVTNNGPSVNIVSPTNGSVFYIPTNILLVARAGDPDEPITNVEFFDGTNDLGPGSPVVLDPPGVNGATGLVYIFNWSNAPLGSQTLTAVATDSSGESAVSPTVNITVLQGPPPGPPIVRIISPPNGAVFFAPVNIPLFAFVSNPGGPALTTVQFYDGTNVIGVGQPIPSPVAAAGSSSPAPIPIGYPTNVYYLVWTNPPVGSHTLTAVATIAYLLHALAIRVTSPPVDITVLPSPPPPTNAPIVSIVATDPVAIEGTNSWTWMGETNTPPTWATWPTAVCRFFTNCGPKTATFTVRRCGDTNDDTTVAYAIGGTASNGVDYVALPGFVTVPAGERSASITIVPIDDGPPDRDKTVILTLTPSTNTPPDYLIGFPPRAAAIIIDQPGPCPVASMMPDGCFRLSTPGPDSAWFCIEHSTNLTDWTPMCTNQVVNGFIDFVDPCAAAGASGFYRVVPVTNTPSQ